MFSKFLLTILTIMDNRRVAKAYRDRSFRAKVLPYPTPAGLLHKVKRYFSGPASAHKPADSPARSTSEQPNKPSIPASINTSLIINGGDQCDSNRILSSFFQEKGSDPLSQVEYEGVLSLMERSRANISMADTSMADTSKRPDIEHSQIPQSRRSSLYTQKVLRNSSMHDGNSSYVAPDYKPVYHTFSENSHNVSRSSDVSVKRVYQFSGLPSPYRTRIKAPNTAARQTRRISSKLPVETVPETTANSTFESNSTFKPKSKAANSLLSILDGNSAEPAPAPPSNARPLHNPYLKGKRVLSSYASDAPASKKPTTTAEDIAKTASYTSVEALPEEKGQSIFDKGTFPADKEAEKQSEKPETADSSSEEASGAANPTEESKGTVGVSSEASKPAFTFNASTSENTAPSFRFGAKKELETAKSAPTFSFGNPNKENAQEKAPSFSFGSQTTESTENSKPSFSFGAKPTESKNAFNREPKTESAANTFKFGSKAPDASTTDNTEQNCASVKAGESSAPKPFNFGAKTDSSEKPSLFSSNATTAEKKGPLTPNFGAASTSQSGPTFNFGKNADKEAESSSNAKPAFNFGAKAEEPKQTFSFGSKSGEPISDDKAGTNSASKPFLFGGKANETETVPAGQDAKQPKLFSFGQKAEEPKLFSFGKKAEEPNPFSFGKESKDTTKTQDTSSEKKPGFTFGSSASFAKPASNPEKSEESEPTPNFTPKTGFSFGQASKPALNPNSKEEVTKPVFNFGQSSTTKQGSSTETKPAFNFGQSTQAKPAFNFGSNVKEPSGSNGSNGATDISEFNFPSVEVRKVSVDEAKVKEFEKTFEFS